MSFLNFSLFLKQNQKTRGWSRSFLGELVPVEEGWMWGNDEGV
jgi:hypothetical protein